MQILRVTPCPPAPNHTRGEVIRPPSQIKNNLCSCSLAFFWDRQNTSIYADFSAKIPLNRIVAFSVLAGTHYAGSWFWIKQANVGFYKTTVVPHGS